ATYEKCQFCNLVSRSEKMHRIFDSLSTIAESESTVLIEGESGTGKELVARTLHDLSPRKGGPLVCINCAALPDSLLESELFGYKKGSFTGASGDKPGRFSLADGGTLFLDEIGDVSSAMQVRLLRALQERTFEPLGSTKSVSVNIRVIAATNRNMGDLVHKGVFREDLYYRINVVKITMPPLRERKEDIPLLAEMFISRFNLLKGKDVAGMSPEALELLNSHSFPGNIRELENAIEHAFAFCNGGIIEPVHLPVNLGGGSPVDQKPGRSLKDLEAQSIVSALKNNNWNRSLTAQQLGIHQSTLWRKIKKFGINIPNIDGRSHS
ncbi:MAG: sigma 54-interacting transcriptional regulator, partial [Chlorobiales bacterium]|nr:sigma 54-interacting transcriptional regulator [Chlorobiales bacterium]